MSQTEPDPPATPLHRVVLASLVGATIEWYDFFLYGAAAAVVFNKIFFHQDDPLVATMLAFATYALGFVARPVGGVLFGHFGDRVGRKKLLMVSLVMMGTATFAIGLLPTYAQVGTLAPMLLVALRLIQGLAVGGEWGGAILLVAETGHPERRAFWASWAQAGVPIGNLLAAGILAVMSMVQNEADFLAWGWRIPFLLSAVLVAVGYWIRIAVTETPAFEAARRKAEAAAGAAQHMPVVEVFRRHPRELVIGAGLRVGENICYYVITAFSITYMTQVKGLSAALALNAVLIGAAAEAVAIPLFGALADRIGRRPVYAIGAVGSAIWGFGFFALVNTGSTPAVIAAVVIGLVLHGAMYGPQAAFMAELFSTRVRYTGASIAYQATSIVAGSLAPIIAILLLKVYDKSSIPISIYVCAACLITAVAALAARETRGKTFEEIDGQVSAS